MPASRLEQAFTRCPTNRQPAPIATAVIPQHAPAIRQSLPATAADPMSACDPTTGSACRDGLCQNLCMVAGVQKSNVGCEYWGVDLDNAMISATSNAAAQQYAIVVSNPQPDVPVTVHVFQDDGQPGEFGWYEQGTFDMDMGIDKTG